jgi:hypothetical protein
MTTAQAELAEARSQHSALLTKRQRLIAQTGAVSDEALSASSAHIAALEAAIEREAQRAKARDAASHLAEFKRLAAACDDALTQLTSSYEGLKAVATELRLACGSPHARSFQLAAINSLATALVQTDLRTELIPPGRRRTFTQNALEWSRSVEAAASGRIEQ